MKVSLIKTTTDLRMKMLEVWDAYERGKMSVREARTHIAFARTILDTIKVEIGSAFLNLQPVSALSLNSPQGKKTISGEVVKSK